jgi:hypothetical protein
VLAAVVIYALFTLYLTWPLVTELGNAVYIYPKKPAGPGDLAGAISQLRELVDGHHNPFLPGRIHDFDAPGGLEIRWALNLASFSSTLILYGLAALVGATAAFGVFVMLGYVASGAAMFLLAHKLTGSRWIALVIGWAFAFYPFAVVKAEHPFFVHGWVFVLMAWRMLALMERPTLRNGFWAGAATVLALSWMQYFVLLGGVFFAVFTCVALTRGALEHDFRRHLVAHLPSIGLVVIFGLVMRQLLASSGENSTLVDNPLGAIVGTAARLPMYVVPPAHNILLGGVTSRYLTEHGWNGVEWTLYVGVTIIALALVGVIAALDRRLSPPATRTVVAFSAVAVAAVLFSLPPETRIGGHAIKLPSYLAFEAAAAWRVYTRFVVIVMLALCILAALGLFVLTRNLEPRRRAALLTLVTILVPLDLWDRPPKMTYRIETPAVYQTLRALPPGIVAEYPLRPVLNARDYLDLYYQHVHGKPILNGYLSGIDEWRALSLGRLDQTTAGRLATLGVRYVLLTPQRIVRGEPVIPNPGRPSKSFHLLDRDSYGSLYRVDSRPTPFVEAYGLEPPEGPPSNPFRWVTSPEIQVEVDAPCRACEGDLRFTSASLGVPRLLRIRTSRGGRTSRVVGVGGTSISVPVRFDRRIILTLTTSPGPRSIHEVTGTADPRSVSIWVRNLHFRFAGTAGARRVATQPTVTIFSGRGA